MKNIEGKKARTDEGGSAITGIIDNVASIQINANASGKVLFDVFFLKGNLTGMLLADQDVDTNLLPLSLPKTSTSSSPGTKIAKLDPPHSYAGISGNACIRCIKKLTLDIYLKLRHSSRLHLRNIL